MTSKIVVNNIEADSGINTVSFNDQIKVGSETTIHSTGIDLGSGNINSHNLNSTGIVTAIGLDISGNVSIAGTLTYQDVTNIDAVGIITAQSGIHVTSGSVGIGTTNPDSLLHVKGTTGKLIVEDTNGAAFIEAKSGGTNSSDDGVGLFKFVNTGYTGASGLQARTASNGSNLELLFMSGQFAEAVRINESGKVGIGTNNPARKVEIFDTAATVLQLNSTNTGGTSLRIQNSGTDKMYMGLAGDFITGQGNNVTDSAVRASGSLLLASGGATEKVRITSAGKVGIGTESPSTMLEVGSQSQTLAGAITISNGETIAGGSGPLISLKHGPAGGTQRTHQIYSYIGDLRIVADSNENMEFHTGGSESLRITSAGYVTTPNQPSFCAYKNGHFTFTSNSDTVIKPWTEHHDTHSDFNATTGVFTAPVAGKYFFYVTVMQQRTGNGDFQLRIYKNGALYVSSNDMNDSATTTFQQTTVNGIVDLAANDTASFVTRNSTDTSSFLYTGHYTHCGGYLIG